MTSARSASEEPWETCHPTLELIRHRRQNGSTPGSRKSGDEARVALIVEGGGMRGIISAAMLSAIDDLGFKSSIDVIYAHSAGAVNAAYFLAGDTWYPLSIYYDHLATRNFVDFLRPLRRMPIMSLRYAFDEVVDHLIPLDYQRVRTSPTPLVIAVSMVDTHQGELFTAFRDTADLREALMATCWLPFATPGTARFRGRPAVDGGVLMPSLLEAAERDGATHVLSLRTRPTHRPSASKRFTRGLTGAYLDRLSPGLGKTYRARCIGLLEADELARAERALEVGPLPHLRPLARHETDGGTLLTAARHAYAAMYALLEKVDRADLIAGAIEVVPRLTVRTRDVEPGQRHR